MVGKKWEHGIEHTPVNRRGRMSVHEDRHREVRSEKLEVRTER
jgi:hypothetical protein